MWVYDIECLKNYFLVCFLNVKDGSRNSFEISDFKNQTKELKSFLTSGKIQLIGYNCLSYDSQLIEYILSIKNRLVSPEEMYTISQETIDSEFPKIPEWNLKIPHLDLFKIWHYDNKAKRTSLKWLQYMMDWHNIEEMPLEHYNKVTEKDRESIESYCWNDVESTLQFYNITLGKTELKLYKGKDKLSLRKNINELFRLNSYNWNDVKIGDSINKKVYLELSKKERVRKEGTIRDKLRIKDCISDKISFITKEMNEIFNEIKETTFDPKYVKEHPGWEFNLFSLVISFGFGGIHSIDQPGKFEADEENILLDRDVASMYPARILNRNLYPAHLGPEWLKGYKWMHDERVYKWKNLAKKDPIAASFSEVYKLAMNGGGFGKTNEINSWQYDPFVTFSVTLDNQFLLLMLAEKAFLNGINVISLNTDGIVCFLKKDQLEIYNSICKEWMKITEFILEDTYYTKYIRSSGNDYIAETINGEIKYKGDYEIDKELHKNKSSRIIPIALKEYFINNKPIEDTIRNHKNIFDFCIGMRAKQDAHFELRKIVSGKLVKEKLQKTIRYFISNSGCNIYKIYSDGRVSSLNVNPIKGKSWYKTLLNKYDQNTNYINNVNFNYYIYETKKIIQQVEKIQNNLI